MKTNKANLEECFIDGFYKYLAINGRYNTPMQQAENLTEIALKAIEFTKEDNPCYSKTSKN